MNPGIKKIDNILISENFTLKLLCEDDLYFCNSLYQDSELMKFVGNFSDDIFLNQSLKLSIQLNKRLPFERLTYCIFNNDRRIGITSLIRSKQINKHCEIGTIIHRSFLNLGVAREVMEKLIHYAFSKLEIERIYARFSYANKAANKLVQKLGFNIDAQENGLHYCYIDMKRYP
ncbi:MAG TPA: N-acetyltransferase [Aeromonadales bacterium]|nr:N-acetyltransferase [Aeromonadales bacterium]